MSSHTHAHNRGGLLLLLAIAAVSGTALADTTRNLTIAAQGDSESARNYDAALELPIGAQGWTRIGLGRSTSGSGDDKVAATLASLGFGGRGEYFGASVDYASRDGDDTLTEQDVNAALDYFGASASGGIDLFYRTGSSQLTTTISGRRRTYTANSTEDFTGRGIGVHAAVDITDRFSVFASGMRYDYNDAAEDTQITTRFRFLSGSAVSRDTAFNDLSLTLGGRYAFAAASATLEYLRDRALSDGAITHTAQLAVEIPLGACTLTPALGYSKPEDDDGIAFGGLALGLSW